MSYEPTKGHRDFIRGLAERHVRTADMSLLLEQLDGTVLSEAQLLEFFRYEIDMGTAIANLAIVDGLHKLAKSGNATALIYLSKVKLGWTENAPPSNKNPGDEGTGSPPAQRMLSNREMRDALRIVRKSSGQS